MHFIIVRLQSILMQFKFTKTSFYEKKNTDRFLKNLSTKVVGGSKMMGESEKTVYLFTAFNEFCPS